MFNNFLKYLLYIYIGVDFVCTERVFCANGKEKITLEPGMLMPKFPCQLCV